MDIKKASEILELDLKTDLSPVTVKKQYHKLALLYHPDKNNGSIEANDRFREINEAYKYLMPIITDEYSSNNTTFTSTSSTNDTNTNTSLYSNLLVTFINSIINKDVLTKIIKDIVTNGYKAISKKIIEDLDKETLMEVYSFLCKYKNILFVSSDTIELVKNVLKDKYQNDQIIILNPTIDDLLENNIYKLNINNEVYLVPLWHNELYFDSKSNDKEELIVLCEPDLPENISIDENNHIIYDLIVEFDKQNLLVCNYLNFQLGKKFFSIPCNKLFIKQSQIYTFKGQGISQIDENNMYNIDNKSDIIVRISFY